MGGFLIITIGIVHGANDISILKRWRQTSSVALTLLYIGVVLLGCVAFFFFPALALPTFVGVSAYHFGEQHWENRLGHHHYHFWLYLLYGCFVFSLLFYCHAYQVQEVVAGISGQTLSQRIFFPLLLGSGFALFTLMVFRSELRPYLLFESILAVLLLAIFSQGSLILAFGFYFVVWHSYPSLKSQFDFLYGPKNFFSNVGTYIQSSLLYWLLAVVGLSIAYSYVDFTASYVLPLFFTFLAAITFPHVVVIHWMFDPKK